MDFPVPVADGKFVSFLIYLREKTSKRCKQNHPITGCCYLLLLKHQCRGSCKNATRLAHVAAPVSEGRARGFSASFLFHSCPGVSTTRERAASGCRTGSVRRKSAILSTLQRKNKTKHPHTGETVPHCVGGGAPRAVICKGHFSGLPSCHTVWIPPKTSS